MTPTSAPVGSRSYELTDLGALEAESIHIIREVAAEFERLSLGARDAFLERDLTIEQRNHQLPQLG